MPHRSSAAAQWSFGPHHLEPEKSEGLLDVVKLSEIPLVGSPTAVS
jgi:hypothetical protein